MEHGPPRGEPTYRYFAAPHRFSAYSVEPRPCTFCGATRPGYARRRTVVCDACLRAGRAAQRGIAFNEGDVGALRDQLGGAPALTAAQRRTLAEERTAELMYRTPPLVTWQDFAWPAHCGDFCRFVKEVGQPDLVALAPDGDGAAFLAAHLHDVAPGVDRDGLWDDVRTDSPRDNSVAYGSTFYLFQCLGCGEYLVMWDLE